MACELHRTDDICACQRMRYASLIVTKPIHYLLDNRALPVTDARTWNMSHLISILDSRISMLAGMSTHPAPVYPERDCLSDIMLGMQVRQHDISTARLALAQSVRTVHIVMDLDSCIQLSYTHL